MFNNSLKKLWGFHPMQEGYFNALHEVNPQLLPARITFSSHDLYKILILNTHTERSAKVRGHFYHNGDELPVVGDWVAIELVPGDHQHLPIEATLPRVTSLKRPSSMLGHQTLLANVDYIGLVTSFNQDLNERRLERGLVMIEDSGAKPIVIINKNDLLDEDSAKKILKDLTTRFGDVPILSCSARTGGGIREVAKLFREGQSVSFLGMSGVGKSSLINALIGEDYLLTKEIRIDDSRGRHTTTHRELFLTKAGFWLLDTPGLRAFSFLGEKEALEHSFDDITSLVTECRFKNCSHSQEPGCKVNEALHVGELSTDRWENYLKLKREMEFHNNKRDKAYNSMRKKEWAKRSAALRQRLKEKGRK